MKTNQTGLGGRTRQSPDTALGKAGGEDRILLLLLFLFSTATGFAQSGIATQWVRIPTDPPSTPVTRGDHAMADDERRGGVVFRCGMDSALRSLADSWEFDGTNWTLVAESSLHGMLIDAPRDRTMLYGSCRPARELTHRRHYDTWEFDGTNWTLVAEGNCMARTDCVRSGRCPDGANLDDAWEYGLPPLQLTGLERQPDGSLKIRWTGEAPPYQLQSRTNLSAGNWQDEGAPTDQTSATVQPTGDAKFFRVLSRLTQMQ